MKEQNLVVISDLHCGCQFGLCPPTVTLDGGQIVKQSRAQAAVWAWWVEFWGQWVPRVTNRQPFDVVINGDIVDGRHHGTTTQISANLADQAKIAVAVMAPVAKRARRLYVIRGTEAHVGPAAEEEERLAQRLGAVQDETGNYSRQELWIQVGAWLSHLAHHIGTTNSAAYESTAVLKELIAQFEDAAQWGERPPQCVVRSHRHRCLSVEIPGVAGDMVSVVTPGWQLKTPFAYRLGMGRNSAPQIGGLLIRQGDEEPHIRKFVRSLPRARRVQAEGVE